MRPKIAPMMIALAVNSGTLVLSAMYGLKAASSRAIGVGWGAGWATDTSGARQPSRVRRKVQEGIRCGKARRMASTQPAGNQPAVLAELRTDVAPAAWTVGVLVVVGLAVAIAGVAGAIPLWPGVITGGLLAVVAAIIAAQIASARAVVFRITEQRIEIER